MATPFAQSVICPTLIGRVSQLDALTKLVEFARNGNGHIALIAGEAGIGKSRLVAEVRAIATQRGMTILQGRCFEQDRAFPYALLLDLLQAFCTGRSATELTHAFGATASELVKLFPELSTFIPDITSSPALDPEQEKRRIFQALAQWLHQVGAKHSPHSELASPAGSNAGVEGANASPLLLIIEDLHWCDDTSLEWLLTFARQLQASPMLLLLTYRSDEIQPALNQLLAALDRTQLATEFTLSGLTREEVAAMLRAIFDLSQPPTPEFLDTLYALTEGNPLFVEEVLKSLIAAGDIFYADGRWDRKPLDELRIPRTIQVAVHQRTSQLSAKAKDLLTLAAVAGRRFDFALLQALMQQSEGELLPLIKETMAAQLVVEESAETFAFRHALTREAVVADLLARERQALHHTIAETIAQVYAESLDMHAGDLAYHCYEAGEWAKALAWARHAGDRAESLYAHEEALRHYERARKCAEVLNQPNQLAMIDEAMGNVHDARGALPNAAEYFERALSRTVLPDKRAALKAKIGEEYAWDNDARGQAFLQAALNELNPETQANELARANVMLGRYHWYRSQYTMAIEFYERGRQLAEPLDDAKTLGQIYFLLASAYSVLLRLDESMAWARRCLALGERESYPTAVAGGYFMLTQSLELLGRWQDTLDSATRMQQVAEQIGATDLSMWADYYRTGALHERGDLAGAAALARKVMTQAQELGQSRVVIDRLGVIALIETDLGNEGAARENATRALSQADASGELGLQCGCRHILAFVYMQREEWTQAMELFDQCMELLVGADSQLDMLLIGPDRAETYRFGTT